jgi:lipid II:glycine glycyltransferase (peptidoglycan interpeptide bridge formation enzyme)
MIEEINDKNLWDDFAVKYGPKSGSFLQSFLWGEFQKSFGRKIWRLGSFDGENLNAIALIIKHDLPLGKNYLYCPRGPIMNHESRIPPSSRKMRDYGEASKNHELFIEEISKIAKKKKSIFFRFDPPTNYQLPVANCQLLKTKPIQPPSTTILNLTKSEDELLAAMHPKTRYNIKVASRHEVMVQKLENTEENFEIFWKLLEETSHRDGFCTHPKKYYKKMLENLPNISLFVAKYKNKPLAAELVMFFGETATYLHGASSEKNREVMAPYAIHWEIIKEAKKMGCLYYDFWGIDEKKWPGVTRFKRGFGGEEISYPGTLDLPVQKIWYKMYCWARKMI